MITLKKLLPKNYIQNKSIFPFIKESFWIIIGNILNISGSIVLIRNITEKIDPTIYGELILYLTIPSMISLIVFGGISNSIYRFYSFAIEENDLRGYLKAIKKIIFLIAITLLFFSIFIAIFWLLKGQISLSLNIISIYVYSILFIVNTTLNLILQAARKRLAVSFHIGIEAWIKILILNKSLVLFGYNVTSIIFAYSFSLFLSCLSQIITFNYSILRNNFKKNTISRINWYKKIWSYAWPFSSWGIFTWAQQSSDRWSLGLFTTKNVVGEYGVIFQLTYASIGIFTDLITTLIGPIFFQEAGSLKSDLRVKSVHNKTLFFAKFGIIMSLIIFLISLFFHENLAQVFLAKEYNNKSYLMPWLFLSGGLFSSGQMLSLKFFSEINSKGLIKIKVFTSLIGFILNFYATYLYGINGLIISLLVHSIIYLLWLFYIVNNSIKYKN